MATQIAKLVAKKAKRSAVIAVREQFKGKDLVNLREFLNDGDAGYTATKAGFTIPVEQFGDFMKAMRKFGKAAGLLGKTGDDDFEIKSLDELDDSENVLIAGAEPKQSKKEKKAQRTGIVRRSKDLPEEKEEKAGKKKKDKEFDGKVRIVRKSELADDTAKGKKAKAKDDDSANNAFGIKAFKKLIKAAAKHPNDMDLADDVIQMYKGSKKKLEDILPKHAVNALNKSLENKKDDALKAKAIAACDKHIIEKNFTM